MDNIYYRQEILEALKKKYPEAVNPQLESLVIVQTEDNLYLERSFKSKPEKCYSTAMDFIAEDELIELETIISSSTFNPKFTIAENVDRFLNELDKETIVYCFDDVFTN